MKTNADLSPTEAIVDRVSLHVGTIGPEKVGRPIMLSGMVDSDPRHGGEPVFFDLFLTVEQAELLLSALPDVIARGRAWVAEQGVTS